MQNAKVIDSHKSSCFSQKMSHRTYQIRSFLALIKRGWGIADQQIMNFPLSVPQRYYEKAKSECLPPAEDINVETNQLQGWATNLKLCWQIVSSEESASRNRKCFASCYKITLQTPQYI